MLLVYQTGSLKVGEVIRYTLTYTPSEDRILPTPSYLHVRIKNNSNLALRAAYLHGPYTLHVAAYPSTFNPNRKVESPRREGVPDFEPNLKAAGFWNTRLTVPEDIRESGGRTSPNRTANGEPRSVTWIIEITSQVLFSHSASVPFELLVGRDESSLDLELTAIAGGSGRVLDHQQGRSRHEGHHPAQPKGVYSKAIRLVVDDTTSLWNRPALPDWGKEDEGQHGSGTGDDHRHSADKGKRKRRQKKIHLVVLTHGLHGNLGADMLYLKESIDATAKQARIDASNRRRAESRAERRRRDVSSHADGGPEALSAERSREPAKGSTSDPATAPLSGGQEDLDEDPNIDSEDDDEEVIVRGFNGNAVRTERGIQYLGKRLARYVLELTYPDQPYFPIKRTVKKKLSDTFSPTKDTNEGFPAHAGSSILHKLSSNEKRAYKFTSISFIGHSLGGLVQTYAVAYIHRHSPDFFSLIKPLNFVCLASPMLGLSNENPMYVKFALDFGLVGRTGRDLGLTWRPPTVASTWNAMVNGFSANGSRDPEQGDPAAKPLLRILPTGRAHQALGMFRHRTVYANVVNDGIVPLRTSCLLFLDWRGLGKVGKARRGNGLIGTVASWGIAELTGQSSSPNPSRYAFEDGPQADDSGTNTPTPNDRGSTVPQPAEDAMNEDDEVQAAAEPQAHQFLAPESHLNRPPDSKSNPNTPASAFDSILNFFRPSAKHTSKDLKMFRRSQTVKVDTTPADDPLAYPDDPLRFERLNQRIPTNRGNSVLEGRSSIDAPPKTTIFESAGDLLAPPVPPTSWIIDPTNRARTIFHDRVYHPEDIPPPPVKRPPRIGRSFSSGNTNSTQSTQSSQDSSQGPVGSMRVEEKIARAYHQDMSWRKVLVQLEPDAHNNMFVRRMFANAYGWPVVKHLCDTHFADTYTMRTRDEDEPAADRAKSPQVRVNSTGEEVEGQCNPSSPARDPSELREATDELAPFREGASSHTLKKPHHKGSAQWDDEYFYTSEEEEDEEEYDRPPYQKLLYPLPMQRKRSPRSAVQRLEEEHGRKGTSEAEIADFLTSSPQPVEGHRGLGFTPATLPPSLPSHSPMEGGSHPAPTGSVAEVGLTSKKSIEEQFGGPSVRQPSQVREEPP